MLYGKPVESSTRKTIKDTMLISSGPKKRYAYVREKHTFEYISFVLDSPDDVKIKGNLTLYCKGKKKYYVEMDVMCKCMCCR